MTRTWITAIAIAATVATQPTRGRQTTMTTAPGTATVFAVGDIMDCNHPERAEAVGELLQDHLNRTPDSTALTLGDNSQNGGTREDYGCLDRSIWSSLAPALRPVPGNHD